MTQAVHTSTESRQDYCTPMPLIARIAERFGVLFSIDLAASIDNHRCDEWLDLENNALSVNWESILQGGVGWLNPPFRGVDPWMEKCKKESARGARIISLTLASIGTGWYHKHVQGNALSLVLRERVTFEGCKDPFPKELMVTLWGFGMVGFGTWSRK